MSETDNEPQALVFRGDDQVASGPTGARFVVEPGAYTVRVGSGPTPQMVSVAVDVQAGATTVVPVRWSGLRIEVVDASNLPYRGAYELIRVTDRQPFTVGFGADTLQGEQLRTLLMPPGLYRIVQPGANYRARTDFATVLAPEGGLVHYKLVIDPDDGRFRGAGVVLPAELGAVPELSPWSRRYILGLSAPFGSTRNVVGANNETTFGTELFFDTYVTYQRDRDLFSGVFELESGFQKVRPEASAATPWRKTHDRLRVDVLYSRFVNARVGPYARFGLRTSLFESNMLVTEDTLISRHLNDGPRESMIVPANSTFPTGDAFCPPEYREGAGLNTRLLQGRTVRLDWRVGAGLHQNRFAGAFFLDDDETTSELEYVEGDNFNEIGLETVQARGVRHRDEPVAAQEQRRAPRGLGHGLRAGLVHEGFDAFAGVIKSGGCVRGAPKMVFLNVDHPDIMDFIDCKIAEERKAWALIEARYDGSVNSEACRSVFFENSNNSVGVSDEFMMVVIEDRKWRTTRRVGGSSEPAQRYQAREITRWIADAAHGCGDPGM